LNKAHTTLFFLSTVISIWSQTATVLVNLETPALDETSGLLFYNNKVITFNDSGNEAELYEIEINTGIISRTVTINNASNVDWEDIAQDSNYIYIGDIGNNLGNRTDLKIYKISKVDYNGINNTAMAEIISFSYADQLDFTPNLHNTNWDAEGLISLGDNLLIFTKNWTDNQVNVYSIPKSSGNYIAQLESSYNTAGLITGADISPDESQIFLTGYSVSQAPFIYTIHDIPGNNLDVFTGKVSDKISNIVPIGNQIEGIALYTISPTKSQLYLSNERFTNSSGTNTLVFPAKLWTIEVDNKLLNIQNEELKNLVNIYLNPFNYLVKLDQIIDEITIYDTFGKIMAKQYFADELSLKNLNPGAYFFHLKMNNSTQIRKIIKN